MAKSLSKRLKALLQTPESKYSVAEIFRWLWRSWRGNRLQAILNAVVGLLGVAVSLGQVSAVRHAIDVASGVAQGNLYWSVGVMGLLILASFGLGIAAVWIRNILGVRAQNRMQQLTLDRILRSEWHGRERFHSGDVLNRLETDVSVVVGFLTETIPDMLSLITMFAGAFVYLYLMDHWLAVITVAILPVFLGFSKIYVKEMRHLTRSVRNYDSRVQTVMQETVQNRMLIKTMESENRMVDRLEDTQHELRRRVVSRTKFSVFSNFIVNGGFALGYLIAFLWAAVRMSTHTLTFGGMTAFLQLVNRIQRPARNLAKVVPAFVSVFTAAERLMELEENPLEEQGEPIALDGPCGIRLSHVTYAYDEADGDVLSDLSFDFRPGSCTAILGETGAGKTTLVRLILALTRPQQGRVEIYGRDGKAVEVSPLTRCNLVYVPQGNTLLSGTLRENLLLGRPSATEEEMRDALHKSCADFVFDLPDGLDTKCGEQGGGLSEGQAQRVAIARALLRDRPVMLFDEATSALDAETERQLLQNILADRSKSIIFITHRLAVVDYCDATLKVERNK